ncbi:MAG TPA: hypothetical protein VK327_09180 [Candidatus Paceibacterota bacterium]|nr:hypothetical protein [Candidatus Paceibacterota bacterium]
MKDTTPYGRWWLINAGVTSIAVFLYFTLHFATLEYLSIGMYMGGIIGILPATVTVALGSLVFIITKALLQKRIVPKSQARAYILGPALILLSAILYLAFWQTTGRQRWKQLVGSQFPPPNNIQVAGCSGFLAGEWVAVCQMNSADFANLVRFKELKPVESIDLSRRFSRGLLSSHQLVRSLSTWTNAGIQSFERVYRDDQGNERGGFFAAHDPSLSTAIIARSYHD